MAVFRDSKGEVTSAEVVKKRFLKYLATSEAYSELIAAFSR